jgi:hypothetical protein
VLGTILPTVAAAVLRARGEPAPAGSAYRDSDGDVFVTWPDRSATYYNNRASGVAGMPCLWPLELVAADLTETECSAIAATYVRGDARDEWAPRRQRMALALAEGGARRGASFLRAVRKQARSLPALRSALLAARSEAFFGPPAPLGLPC